MATVPIVISSAGAVARLPAAIQADLLARVAATNPGYTATLPGILIEDISSTDIAAIAECDSAMVETINSLTPYGANLFLLAQLGQMLGIPVGQQSNTSVLVRFTGTPGFVIAQGFVVSDGTHQYVLTVGGIVGEADPITGLGTTSLLFAVAGEAGSWAVPPGSVKQLVTSIPPLISLEVINPEAGLPGQQTETAESYRKAVLQANLAASQGMARYLKTLVGNVPGVQRRLISVKTRDDGKWMVIVGGGDTYQVANAIWTALFDVNNIVGSELIIAGITNALPGVITTFLNHGLVAGDDFNIADCNPSNYDGDYAVAGVPGEKQIKMGKRFAANNLTAISWSGGVVTATTTTNHNLTVGSTVQVLGCVPTGYNGTFVVTALPSSTQFRYALVSNPGVETTLGQLQAGIALFDTTGITPWVLGGVITPNPRNVSVPIFDYPNTYLITYVSPPRQDVSMVVTWDTSSTNLISPAAIAQAAAPALATYINAIPVGQPINQYQMQTVFEAAISNILAPELVVLLTFAVSINGIATPVTPGLGIFEGDPESYFATDTTGANIVVTRA